MYCTRAEIWLKNYQGVITFQKEHGGRLPTRSEPYGIWVHTQQIAYKKGTLLPERYELLREIGVDFVVPLRKKIWNANYQGVITFQIEHDGRLPKPREPYCSWINTQKTAYKKGKLSLERYKLLVKIGVVFDTPSPEEQWEAAYQGVIGFQNEHNGRLPTRSEPYGPWINTQKTAHKKGKLPLERFELLMKIGVVFDAPSPKDRWDTNYQGVIAFQNEHDGRLPKAKEPYGIWLQNQKAAYRIGKLLPERYVLLVKIGVQFPQIPQSVSRTA